MAKRKVFEAVINAAAELRKLGGNQAERMARAAEQNFNTPVFHYSRRGDDITEFSQSQWDKSPFAIGPHVGSKEAAYDRFQHTGSSRDRTATTLPGSTEWAREMRQIPDATYPLMADISNPLLDPSGNPWKESDLMQYLTDVKNNKFGSDFYDDTTAHKWLADEIWAKHDAIPYVNDVEAPGTISYIMNPKRLRSVNADFNPEYRDSPNLLASVAGAMPYAGATAALLAGATPQEAEAGPLQTLGRAAPYLTSAALGGAAALRSGDAEAGGMPEYEQRLSQIPYPNIDNGDGSRSTHEMAVEVDDNGNWFAFPTIQPGDNGQLQRFELRDAQQRAMATGNYKAFGQDKDAALRYGEGGYKVGTNIDPNTPPQIDFNRYMDVMGRTNAAMNKISEFKAKRAGKRGAMDIMKLELQTLLKGANEVANDVIFPALDKPLQGYLGLSEVFSSLAQGKGFDTAMQRGAQVATQPVDTTTYNMGGTVTDSLSPYVPAPVAAGAGALTHAGALLASPF